ncbi:relaxase domain-containing protein [Sphingomonas sp. MG17]|uniref:Relaxase domain-containing protein n=1 Tax=Sphingomonas tagetis TaxID=2949092 RepID=A0A9X2HK62_9SPHN|nr:MobF family relaxase [Sphingomonas tagetis]MCP3729304.1 relaxase domain-containing protein [Sphingomonas tagetis]
MIHPRRLKGSAGNIARYYAVGDYYSKGADEHSEWGGRIAVDLGLTGRVEPAMLQQLLEGRVDGQQLGRQRREGGIEHHPGWDFAVNAPKSVSIMALVSGDERIIAAHERAVDTALDYLEEHALLRHRMNGEIVHKVTGRLLFARFTEHASRELDPHLHTHVVVLNITNREEGAPMASLETRAMFAEQMPAGQVYRNELAFALREHGYSLRADPRTGLFEIEGVPRDLIAAMSQRAEQIDAHAQEHGLTGQAARRVSFYETRAAKEKVCLDDLQARWAARSAAHEPAIEVARRSAEAQRETVLAPTAAVSARAMLFGLRQAEGKEAVNNLGRMLQLGLASHLGEVRLADIRPHIEAQTERRRLLKTRGKSGDEVHTRGRTSRRTARLELALSDHLALALEDARPLATVERLREASKAGGLTPGQEAALLHLGSSSDRVTGLHGVAGAGKSTLVRTLRAAAGSHAMFIAVAPTSSAAANLGASAGIESRTVASLLAGGGHGLGASHVIVLDEAGQLGNRQALRLLEISRASGAKLIMLGDNKQTGAIEQGKPFWLMQKLGLPNSDLAESVRQETRAMKAAVTQARAGNYAGSLANLDRVVAGENASELARGLVREWTRLKPVSRTNTNILVLENATRLVVNTEVRKALKAEGAVAAEDTRIEILAPAGMSDQEKHFARFYTAGQVLVFSRDNARLGIARDAEYRVAGVARDATGRHHVQLIDAHGRVIRWDPRLGRASQVNVFHSEQRDLAAGDRIQWRLVNRELGLRNAERGTIKELRGNLATIRWDSDGRKQDIDLGRHKSWDHGYSETVYSAQSKTYDRVYVLAPVNSALVTGQNYYTAITRARFGVKLWTEDQRRLVDKLERRSGEKSSALEGLGRLGRDTVRERLQRHGDTLGSMQRDMLRERAERRALAPGKSERQALRSGGVAVFLASKAASGIGSIDRWLQSLIKLSDLTPSRDSSSDQQASSAAFDRGSGHDR